MSQRIGYRPKRVRRRTFIKKWREYRNLTQDELAERLETSKASISRVENGQQAYTQDLLEACADILKTTPAGLLEIDPTDEEATERLRIEKIVRTVMQTTPK